MVCFMVLTRPTLNHMVVGHAKIVCTSGMEYYSVLVKLPATFINPKLV